MGIGSQEGGVMGSDPIVLLSTDSIDITILQKLDKLEDYDPQRQPVENDYTRELVITYPLNGNSRILTSESINRTGLIHHPPFTIHHPPSTIHHSPSTIHHPPYPALAQTKTCPQLLI